MNPEIEFRYSGIYDARYRNSIKIQEFLKKNKEKYPSIDTIEKYISKIKPLWKEHEKKILIGLSKITGLKWKEERIICYIIGYGRCFSDPLTVKLFKNKNDFIDTLTHELIHQIQFQNDNKLKKWWKFVYKRYRKESRLTKNHILLHAIHSRLMLDLFGEKRLKREIKNSQKFPDYKRSWDIVEKEGYENIIKEFKKRLR